MSEILVDLRGHISFGPPKTRASIRTVTLPCFVCDELARIAPTGPEPDTRVFRSPEGFVLRPTSFRRRVWNPAVERAGLSPLRIHDLRHTFASWGLNGGLPLTVIGGLLSHSQPRTTQRYAHLSAEPLKAATEQVADALAGAMANAAPAEVALNIARRRS